MPMAILFSWLIAGGEYTLQVPANRIGALQAGLQPTTLRCIAELATLVAFLIFQSLVLGQPVLLNHVIGFAVVFLGVLTGIYPECAHPTTVSHTHELATGCGATPPTIEQKDGWLSYECPPITPDLLASRGRCAHRTHRPVDRNCGQHRHGRRRGPLPRRRRQEPPPRR